MSDRDEWGPWIEHDGKGCPCVGSFVRVELFNGETLELIAGEGCRKTGHDPNGPFSCWVWSRYAVVDCDVARYRIRKPRALIQLRDMIETLPAPRQKEDA